MKKIKCNFKTVKIQNVAFQVKSSGLILKQIHLFEKQNSMISISQNV